MPGCFLPSRCLLESARKKFRQRPQARELARGASSGRHSPWPPAGPARKAYEGVVFAPSRPPAEFSRIILIFEHRTFRVTTLNGVAAAALGLDQLPSHQWATVLDVQRHDGAEDRETALRLTEIGFVPGEAVRIVASGVPGREPLAVRLGHTTFALRRHEAALIRVVPGAAQHG